MMITDYKSAKLNLIFTRCVHCATPQKPPSSAPSIHQIFLSSCKFKSPTTFFPPSLLSAKKMRHFWLSKLGWSFLFPTFVILVWKVNLAIIWGYPLLCNFHIFSLLVFHNYEMYSIPIQR